jgi:acetyl esterase/lipase
MSTLLLSLLVIGLWPNGAPGPKASDQREADTTKPSDKQVAGRPVIRLGPVTEPSLTVYPAAKSSKPSPAILVFPGGGYRILAYDLEGTEICSWLNSIGITGVLVKYRVSTPGGASQYERPLQDAQLAMGIVRSHASEWNIDPHNIGVLGFSAGGHLSAVLSNHGPERTYPKVDEADRQNARPDFSVLVYPAYLTDVSASAATPPTFIVQAEDDAAFIDGTLAYYKALKAAKVPTELHLFSAGGHGYGMRPTKDAVTGWPHLAENWIRHVLR